MLKNSEGFLVKLKIKRTYHARTLCTNQPPRLRQIALQRKSKD